MFSLACCACVLCSVGELLPRGAVRACKIELLDSQVAIVTWTRISLLSSSTGRTHTPRLPSHHTVARFNRPHTPTQVPFGLTVLVRQVLSVITYHIILILVPSVLSLRCLLMMNPILLHLVLLVNPQARISNRNLQ